MHAHGSTPPGPSQSPLLLTYHWLQRPYDFLDECAERYGDTFSLSFRGLPPMVVFSNPDDVKEIFHDDGESLQAGKFNLTLKAFLGSHSVLMLDGKEHRRQRKLLLPPFHGERMQAYGRDMLDITQDEIAAWPLGRTFSFHETMQSITLRVILRAIFGMEEGPREVEMRKAIVDILEIAAWPPLLIPALQKDWGPWSPYGKFLRKNQAGSRLLLEEIGRRRREGTAGRADILSLLVDARDEDGEPMSDHELRDELVTLLVAGHETTATALSWAFRWLLAHPSIELRLIDEIDSCAASSGLTPAAIAQLPLVDAVAREALRLNPVIPIVGRVLARPMRVGGWELPAGVAAVCSIYLAHRRPDRYPDPTRFDPDRFLGKKLTPNEFFPFGGGVRRCIGMAFALYEMKMVIAKVVREAQLRLARRRPIRVVRRAITLTPSDGLEVVLTTRRPTGSVPRASAEPSAGSGAPSTAVRPGLGGAALR